jgi:hypothetical protein
VLKALALAGGAFEEKVTANVAVAVEPAAVN